MANDLEELEGQDDLPPLEDLPEPLPRRRQAAASPRTPSPSSSESPGPSPRRKPKLKPKKGVVRSRDWYLDAFNEMAAKGSFSLGEAAQNVLPTTSSVLMIRSPVVGDAVEEGARRDPRVYAVAKAVYESQIYVLMIGTLGAILMAVAIDLGRMPVYTAETDEGVVGVNPLARFILPKESLGVAISVGRYHRQRRATSAGAPAAPAQPVQPPGWYAGAPAGAAGGVE